MAKAYPKEFRDRAVRAAQRRGPGTRLEQVAEDFGICISTLHRWLHDAVLAASPKPEWVRTARHGTAERLRTIAAAPRPDIEPVAWPELRWDATNFKGPLPADATAAEVVRSYIVAIHHWENSAGRAIAAAHRAGRGFPLDGPLAEAAAIRELHCTCHPERPARFTVESPPALAPDISLLRQTSQGPSRIELLTGYLEPTGIVREYETLFVCVRGRGAWRIDSAHTRLLGTENWEPVVL